MNDRVYSFSDLLGHPTFFIRSWTFSLQCKRMSRMYAERSWELYFKDYRPWFRWYRGRFRGKR